MILFTSFFQFLLLYWSSYVVWEIANDNTIYFYSQHPWINILQEYGDFADIQCLMTHHFIEFYIKLEELHYHTKQVPDDRYIKHRWGRNQTPILNKIGQIHENEPI